MLELPTGLLIKYIRLQFDSVFFRVQIFQLVTASLEIAKKAGNTVAARKRITFKSTLWGYTFMAADKITDI